MDGRLARKSGVGAALLAAALLTAASSAGTHLFLTVVIGCGSSCSLTSVARALLLPRRAPEFRAARTRILWWMLIALAPTVWAQTIISTHKGRTYQPFLTSTQCCNPAAAVAAKQIAAASANLSQAASIIAKLA